MSFIQRLKDSTIGFNGYVRLINDKAGGFGYMTLVLLIALVVSCTWNTIQFSRGLTRAAMELEKGPDFSFENGEVHFAGPMPYRLVDTPEQLVIIDTTGKTTPDVLNSRRNSILITRTAFYQVDGMGATKGQDLRNVPFTFTKANVISLMRNLYVLVPVGYIFIFLFQLGTKALDACILGLIAMAAGGAMRRSVPFDLGFKVALYAMTVPILVQWIIPGFTTLRWWGFVAWWGIAIVYMVLGLRAYIRAEAAPVE